MTINVLFAADPADWPAFGPALHEALAAAGFDFRLTDRTDDPASVDYIVFSPGGTLAGFPPFTRSQGGAEPVGGGRESRGQRDADPAADAGWSIRR